MASLNKILREKYDRVVVVVGALTLLLSLGFIVIGIMGGGDDSAQPVPPGRAAAPADLDALRKSVVRIHEPVALASTNSVLVSEQRISCINPECRKLIRKEALVCPFCQKDQPNIDSPDFDSDTDKIPDQYELDNGLDRITPDAEYDLDGDGFTNLEEFQGKTKANDPESHPSMEGKLRMSGVRNHPLNYRLRGMSKSGDSYTFQVNLETLDETLFVKLGQKVKGYTIKSFNAPKEVLTIEREGRTIDLPNGKKVEIARRVAQIVNIIRPNFATNVTVGAVFEVDAVSYLTQDILEDSVTATTGTVHKVEIKIPKETEDERKIRKEGGKLPSAPETKVVPGDNVFKPGNLPGMPAPAVRPGMAERYVPTPTTPQEYLQGFAPPPPEVLQRIREANRNRPQ